MYAHFNTGKNTLYIIQRNYVLCIDISNGLWHILNYRECSKWPALAFRHFWHRWTSEWPTLTKVSAGMDGVYRHPQIYYKCVKLLLVLEDWQTAFVKCMPHYVGHITFWFHDEYAHIYIYIYIYIQLTFKCVNIFRHSVVVYSLILKDTSPQTVSYFRVFHLDADAEYVTL
jgi:hypothetical protein